MSSTPITISLAQFTQGMFMSWTITTQTSCKIQVVLKDSSTEYVNASKQSSNIAPPLSSGTATIAGTDLQFVITNLSTNNQPATTQNNYAVVTPGNVIVGQGFNLCLDDQPIGGDNDYNDLYINLIAWNTKG